MGTGNRKTRKVLWIPAAVLAITAAFSIGRVTQHHSASGTATSRVTIASTTVVSSSLPPIPVTVQTAPRTTIAFLLTNSLTLADALNNASREMAGNSATQAEIDAFVASFHAEELAQQRNREQGSTYYTTDPAASAREYVRTHDQRGIQDASEAHALSMLHDALGGGTTSTSNSTTSTSNGCSTTTYGFGQSC